MTDEKADLLVSAIRTHTNASEIPWTATSTDDAFAASFSKQTIRIRKELSDSSYSHVYFLDLHNSSGRLVDSVTSPYDYDPDSRYSILQDIFNRARDKAFGVDEFVTDLLNELNRPSNKGGVYGSSSEVKRSYGDDGMDDEIPF